MRNISFAFLLLVFFTSCNYLSNETVSGNGTMKKEERNIGDFSGVEVVGSIDVYVAQGNRHTVRVEGDENLMEYVETDVSGGILEIRSKKGFNIKPKAGMKVYITSPFINKFYISGSGDIRSESKIVNSENVEIDVSGSGDVVLEVDAPEVKTEVAGSGTITMKGATKSFFAEIAGSGEVHAFELLSETAEIDIAGSGDVEVFASKVLNVSIAGAGNVLYKGDPVVKQSKAGSGDVRKAE